MQQQSTINVPSGNPVRALTGLARQIALPGEFAPERFPSFPALERTAVMGFSQPATLQLPASTEVKLLLARQATYPVWATQQAPAGASYGVLYNGLGADKATNGVLLFEDRVANGFVGNTTGFSTGSTAQPSVTGATSIGWQQPIVGRDAALGPRPFLWVPTNWSLYAVLSNTTPISSATSFTLAVDYWTTPGEVASATYGVGNLPSNVTGVMANLPISNAWIRPRCLTAVSTASSGQVEFLSCTFLVVAGTASYAASSGVGVVTVVPAAAVTSFYPLVFPTEFQNSSLPWSAARTTASAVLCTNVSQVLNKAGTVLAGRVNPNINNPFGTTSAVIQALHPAEKAWLPLETGLYSYCPPSTDMSLFLDYGINVVGSYGIANPPIPVYRLDNDAMVNLAFITAGAVAEALAVTASWHIEFRTSSALFQVALSGMTLETLHQAQLALAAAGFFFENPEHKSVLERVTRGVYKVAPLAMAALHAAHPTAARVIAAGHNAAVSAMRPRKVAVPQAKMKVPTTSASASGFNGRNSQRKKKVSVKGSRKR